MVQVMPPRRAVTEAMTEGLSLPRPPRISIANGMFTLIDAAGNEAPCNLVDPHVGRYLDVVIAGANQHKSKIYYENGWDPRSSDPPACWSDNGVAPSQQAISPQSATCASCEYNKIGSDVSNLSGKMIKACQDRKKLACFVIGDPAGALYEFQTTPAALKGLAAYGKWVAGHPSASGQGAADVSEVVTRLYFAPGQNGVIAFGAVGGIDATMNARIDDAYSRGLIAEVVGANDQPIQGLLAAPQQQQQLAAPAAPPPPQNWNQQPPAALPAPVQPQPPNHGQGGAQQNWAPQQQTFVAAQPVQQPAPPAPAFGQVQQQAAPVAPPPPPPQPVWDGTQWVLPNTAPKYPAPDPNDPHPGVPAFLARQQGQPPNPSQAPVTAQNGVSPAFQAAPVQNTGTVTSPSNGMPAGPAAPAPRKRGGARQGAGRPAANAQPVQQFAPGQQPVAQPAPQAFQAGAPQPAPFQGQQPQGNGAAPQQQFGMAPVGPPTPAISDALDRAFGAPIPGR